MRSSLATATAAIGLALLAGAASAGQFERGVTADGWPYVVGGFGVEEREELAQARRDFRLRVTTAASGSGALVTNVRVRIADASGRVVFDRALDGPILLIDLAPGRYAVQASLNGETVKSETAIAAGDRRDIVFYFKAPAGVLRAEEILSR